MEGGEEVGGAMGVTGGPALIGYLMNLTKNKIINCIINKCDWSIV